MRASLGKRMRSMNNSCKKCRYLALFCALMFLLLSMGAHAESVFVPEMLVIAYNAAIEPVFEAMTDASSAAKMAKLMEVEYIGEDDGTLFYTNCDQSFFLYFEADSKWSTASNVMAYADISNNSLMKNLPMFPVIYAISCLEPSCDFGEMLVWFNDATHGDVFETDAFLAVYTSEAYDHAALALFPQ